ncbi:MAG TPA: alpha/beta fold hydrolase [Bacteroidota bacterium]|nr:alpha/beta fold hydrolase [Bacteroidota bacterium]
MRLVTDNLGIEFATQGPRAGVPVVLIHGFPFSKEMWKPQTDILSKDYYVITYDIRGHGASDVGDGQYSIELFVDDLFALLDHLKIGQVVAVGLSMGGYIALRAIEREPARFRGLVLCDTKSEADNNDGKVRRMEQVRNIKAHGLGSFVEPFLSSVFHPTTFQEKPDAVEAIRSSILKSHPLAVSGTAIALAARTDTTSSLYTITVPTLIMVGKYDQLAPPSAANAMKEKIPNAVLHLINQAGHMSNLENPGEFNKYLLEFLGKLKTA